MPTRNFSMARLVCLSSVSGKSILRPARRRHREGISKWQKECGSRTKGTGPTSNPVLYADYSDPDAIPGRGGFLPRFLQFQPPARPPGPAFQGPGQLDDRQPRPGPAAFLGLRPAGARPGGLGARPSRWHEGRFWVFFALPDEGIFLSTAGGSARPVVRARSRQGDRGLDRSLSLLGRRWPGLSGARLCREQGRFQQRPAGLPDERGRVRALGRRADHL